MWVKVFRAGSRGLCAVQPLFRTNVSRRDRPEEMFSTLSWVPWMPKYGTGWVPPLQPLSWAPESTATARTTVGRAQATA